MPRRDINTPVPNSPKKGDQWQAIEGDILWEWDGDEWTVVFDVEDPKEDEKVADFDRAMKGV